MSVICIMRVRVGFNSVMQACTSKMRLQVGVASLIQPWNFPPAALALAVPGGSKMLLSQQRGTVILQFMKTGSRMGDEVLVGCGRPGVESSETRQCRQVCFPATVVRNSRGLP